MKNLNYVLQALKLNLGVVGTEYDQQFLQWLIRGMQKLNEYELMPQSVKCVSIPVVNHKAVLPNDYQDYLRIGVCVNGRFYNFDKNDTICTPTDNANSCPCSEDEISFTLTGEDAGNLGLDGGWFYPIYGQPYSYSYTVGSYAIGPGFYHGGYKINTHTQEILFDNYVQVDEVILEYFGDFMNDMGNAYVSNDAMVDVLINYANWQRSIWSPDASVKRDRQSNYTTYYSSLRSLNAKQQKLTKFEWVELVRKYFYQGVKS